MAQRLVAIDHRPRNGKTRLALGRYLVNDAVAPSSVPRLLIGQPVSTRAAIVHLQHRVSLAGEQLHIGVELPKVSNEVRTPVGKHHERRRLARVARARQREVAVNRKPIACRDVERRHLGDLVPIDPRPCPDDYKRAGNGSEKIPDLPT